MIGLNIGSGQRRFNSVGDWSWVNIDCTSRPPDQVPDLVADGRDVPLPDAYADCVVLHQVLEHFGCGEGDALIKEAHRLLKPGGRLIVTVPDLHALASRYAANALDTYLFAVNLYGAYQGEETDRHKWGYSAESLRETLQRSAEWKKVEWFNSARIPPGADIAMDWWILALEATK